eukprot:1089584-Alexandrium_andersonii.AAC.1
MIRPRRAATRGPPELRNPGGGLSANQLLEHILAVVAQASEEPMGGQHAGVVKLEAVESALKTNGI